MTMDRYGRPPPVVIGDPRLPGHLGDGQLATVLLELLVQGIERPS